MGEIVRLQKHLPAPNSASVGAFVAVKSLEAISQIPESATVGVSSGRNDPRKGVKMTPAISYWVEPISTLPIYEMASTQKQNGVSRYVGDIAKDLVSDELWGVVDPLLTPEPDA